MKRANLSPAAALLRRSLYRSALLYFLTLHGIAAKAQASNAWKQAAPAPMDTRLVDRPIVPENIVWQSDQNGSSDTLSISGRGNEIALLAKGKTYVPTSNFKKESYRRLLELVGPGDATHHRPE